MGLIGIAIIAMIAIYILSGVYKGFVWSASVLVSSLLACVFAMLLTGPVSEAIVSNQTIYEAMLSYTEGAEYVKDVEYAKMDVSKLSNTEIEEIMNKTDLPYPMNERVHENILSEAFKEQGITTLGDYFNQSMVMVMVNIMAFLIVYLLLRLIFTFALCWLDYSVNFLILRRFDWLVGGCVGILRGLLGVTVIMLTVPILLTVLPFDAVKETIEKSSAASFFYTSNLLLKLIPGV